MGRRWSCRRRRGSRCAGGEEEVNRNVNVNMMMTNIGKQIERVHRKCIGYPSYWGVLSLLFISTQIIYPHLPDQSVFSSPPINGLSSIPIFHKPLNRIVHYEIVVGTMTIGSIVVFVAALVPAPLPPPLPLAAGGSTTVVNVTVGAGVAEMTFPEASCVINFTDVTVDLVALAVTRAMDPDGVLEIPPRMAAISDAMADAGLFVEEEAVLLLVVEDDVVVDEVLGVMVMVLGVAVTVLGVAVTVIGEAVMVIICGLEFA